MKVLRAHFNLKQMSINDLLKYTEYLENTVIMLNSMTVNKNDEIMDRLDYDLKQLKTCEAFIEDLDF